MKTTENITLYHCDYCKKKLFRKGAMARHEETCLNNPKNHKACFNCIFLEKTEQEVSWGHENPFTEMGSKKIEMFKCSKLDKLMFPYRIERKKLHERFDTYANQEPMPHTCESMKEMTHNEQIDRMINGIPIDPLDIIDKMKKTFNS